MYALMDCSNFFVSCERIFNPSLDNKPVAVLSSNDGCIIARSEEVKALGIPMGIPVFKVKNIINQYNIHTYSSNFTLYSNISDRVLEILEKLGFIYEPCSIDESFIKFPENLTREDLTLQGLRIKEIMKKWLSLPVRVGFGPTKTLAKLANNCAKNKEEKILHSSDIPPSEFKSFSVEEIWGIGRRSARTLAAHNIHTVEDLLKTSERWIRQTFNVGMLRTVRELKGYPCLDFEKDPCRQKSFIISRTFANPVSDFMDLKERIALFVTKAGQKLRKKELFAGEIGVFIMTSRFHKENYYYNETKAFIPQHTQDTRVLIKKAHDCLYKIYKEGKPYKKAGIYLGDTTRGNQQLSFFESPPSQTSASLMKAMDTLNGRYGESIVRFGACGLDLKKGISSFIKREKLSPSYTTSWEDLLKVK